MIAADTFRGPADGTVVISDTNKGSDYLAALRANAPEESG